MMSFWNCKVGLYNSSIVVLILTVRVEIERFKVSKIFYIRHSGQNILTFQY